MGDETQAQASSPFAAMFEGFRTELDEHYDRRERIVKASRDITAASKKIIFTLQRVRTLQGRLPAFVNKNNSQHWQTIQDRYKAIASDVQGMNAYRYGRQITGGNQEFMEAVTFQHYLETQNLISHEDAQGRLNAMGGVDDHILLTLEDYILGIYDMTGELMRFAITAMATNGELPAGKPSPKHVEAADDMETDVPVEGHISKQQPRNVLTDLRELGLQLEMFEPTRGSSFADEAEKKMVVLRQSLQKVETALYGLTVRGSERPKGWVPDMRDDRRAGEAAESY